jgi:threonine synthase
MRYYSTKGNTEPVTFQEALFQGLASDGGLYLPEEIPKIWNQISQTDFTYPELAFEVLKPYVQNEISDSTLTEIVEKAFSFDVPVVKIQKGNFILELFHGPTLAFKDFAARFMARTMEYFLKKRNKELTVLVATSGDTGSAVANGFLGVEGIRVVILYPKGRVSPIQERQLTTLGDNITSLEIDGSFDDCQNMVKSVFMDRDLREKIELSSANSINIARLLPQSVYYFWAVRQIDNQAPVIFSVPSGNFGNLTGGILAKKMGLPVENFVISTNINDVVPKYLKTGIYHARSSIHTLSNAMDVGDPSNLARIRNLYGQDIEKIRSELTGFAFTDDETIETITNTFLETNYILDPHTAVGYSGLQDYRKATGSRNPGVVLATAHPAKFPECIEPAIDQKIPVPQRLNNLMDREICKTPMPNRSEDLKEFLLSRTP